MIDLKTLPVGYTRAEYKFVPRMIVAVDTVERKEGKTHFSLTAPDPIAYMSLDKQSEEDVLKYFEHKEIYPRSYVLSTKDPKNMYEEFRNEFANDFAKIVAHPGIKTIVIDTGSDLYQYVQLAFFGKLTQVQPFRYGEINAWFSQNIIEPIKMGSKNLIVNYTMKKVYKSTEMVTSRGEKYLQSEWTGEYERRGFNDSDGMSQINIRLSRTPIPEGFFKATVMNSSQNPTLLGREFVSNPYIPEPSFDDLTGEAEIDEVLFENHRCSFPWIAQAVFPQTSVMEWV